MIVIAHFHECSLAVMLSSSISSGACERELSNFYEYSNSDISKAQSPSIFM